jgi:hypothetical protein
MTGAETGDGAEDGPGSMAALAGISSFRWPRTGDRPFAPSSDGWRDARIEGHGHARLVMMTTGYKEAGDLLAERAAADASRRDFLVYPAVFVYRQFVELSLKYLIATYGPRVGVGPLWRTHKLGLLWTMFAEVLRLYGHEDADEGDAAAAGVVAAFDAADPKSSSFRFPVDTDGSPVPVLHDAIDLDGLRDVMEGLDSYFSGCDGWLDAAATAAREAEEAMR